MRLEIRDVTTVKTRTLHEVKKSDKMPIGMRIRALLNVFNSVGKLFARTGRLS